MDNATVVLTLTAEQADALKPFLDRPERISVLVQFIDNMLAAKQVSKIIAWAFGVVFACLTAWFYCASLLEGKSPHGVP